ncbi:3-Deoxy-D-manno-octulosonic-acid transferase family protein [uncultured delta proteobacterium]|uniref:3-deoxy-D-manno-octulosonic acid transferase n=1 Tax=uncultured delta proteobacterium TaxID=34034 RepID=A0A212JX27_9DELT|nr:3-Deoxy-D-manno-octulosonic-acid transferase family protein [uncultured delta proteobacterium]
MKQSSGFSPGFSLMLGEYALLWRLARPFIARHKRLRDDFPLRMVPEEWQPPFPPESSPGTRPDIRTDLWIQAASGGESFLTRQLLHELNTLAGDAPRRRLRILCTSCTKQGLDVLRAAGEQAPAAWPNLEIAVRVFPLDEPKIIRRAREYASPKAVVLLETELWPGLMAACAENNTPLVTVNGRMTEKSYSGYRWFAPLWKKIAPARVLAMAEADAARFAALFGKDRVSVMPNMKFDGVPLVSPPPDPASPALKLLPPGLPVILLASVREEEEPLFPPVLAYLRKHAPEAAVVVAPRHMERVPAWRQILDTAFGSHNAMTASAMEEAGTVAAPGNAALWDRFGQLQALYARADAVFVGGSLAKLGGQNFLEAAGQGRIPVIGPHWKNFAWVGEEFFTAGLGRRVADAGELGPALVAMLRAAPDPETVRVKVAAYLAPRRGGTRMAAEAVWEFIT